ncbi:CPBP family intramembrane metalloprotease [Bacillus sp. HMF5848]|nr:CPBP family intramembrane metalloprotease [Bacillus sp. HMF5848]
MVSKQEEIVKQLTEKQLLFHLYMTQLLLMILALIIGFILFDSWGEFTQLWDLKDVKIITWGASFAFFVIIIDLFIMKFVPKHLYDDGGINEKMFRRLPYGHILIVTMIISVTEEILFRGVLQVHSGIWIASLIFALAHIRYLRKWLLLITVVVLSFMLGVMFEVTNNIIITIFAHFLIDLFFASKIRFDYLQSRRGEKYE